MDQVEALTVAIDTLQARVDGLFRSATIGRDTVERKIAERHRVRYMAAIESLKGQRELLVESEQIVGKKDWTRG